MADAKDPTPKPAPGPTETERTPLPSSPPSPSRRGRGNRRRNAIEEAVIEVLRQTFDPEIPVNIYELGLIYGIDVDPSGSVEIRMTLTSPACPVAGSMPGEVEVKVAGIPGVTAAARGPRLGPAVDPGKLSEAARLQLGLM